MKNKRFFPFFSLIICSVPVHAMFSNVGKAIVLNSLVKGKGFLVYNGIENESNTLFFKNKNALSKNFFTSSAAINVQQKPSVEFFENALKKRPGFKESVEILRRIEGVLSEKQKEKAVNKSIRTSGKRLFFGGGTTSILSLVAAKSMLNEGSDALIGYLVGMPIGIAGVSAGGLLTLVGLYKILISKQIDLEAWEKQNEKVTEYLLKMNKSKAERDVLNIFLNVPEPAEIEKKEPFNG